MRANSFVGLCVLINLVSEVLIGVAKSKMTFGARSYVKYRGFFEEKTSKIFLIVATESRISKCLLSPLVIPVLLPVCRQIDTMTCNR